METAQKQRPAWLYVLIGCGSAAGLVCLVGALAAGYCAKSVNDLGKGVTDPAVRQENALKQLGALPDGYNVAMSASMFISVTMLTNAGALEDGGFSMDATTRNFMFQRVPSNDNNKPVRDFLSGKDTDSTAARNVNLQIDREQIVKRGSLTIDGRKFHYVASRAMGDVRMTQDNQQIEGRNVKHTGLGVEQLLNNAVLFDCPGDVLYVGVWSQADPAPDKTKEELELAGTVADEAELARFLKPMNPCGR